MKDSLLVAALEGLEAAQINIGLYTTRVGVAALQHALEAELQVPVPEMDVRRGLQELVAAGEVIEWEPGQYRSRIAETVRVIRLLRQRFWGQALGDAPLLVEDVRVEFRPRFRPKRDAVPLRGAIPAEIPTALADAFAAAMPIATLSRFQADALEAILSRGRFGNPQNEALIVAGDTGAGKTEAFLFPILLDLASEPPEERTLPGVRALLVYPRIRLARNQLSRILRYTGLLCQAQLRPVTVGIQNGDVPGNRKTIVDQWELQRRDDGNWRRVTLLETCIACNGAYWVNEDDPALDTACPRLVCDACGHTLESLRLTQASLANGAPDLLIITDISLHQWLARERFSHLWGLWHGPLQTEPPRYLVLDEVHLYEQIRGAHLARLIKRFQARTRLVWQQRGMPDRYPLVIGVSATLKDERHFLAKLLDISRSDAQAYDRLRVVKPQLADLERTEGRERYLFIYPRSLSPTPRNPDNRVTDQTAAIQIVMAAMHNLKTDPEWRGLAFFDSINDLRQFRHDYDDPAAVQAGNRQRPPANQAELWRIRTDVQARRGNTAPRPVQRSGCGGTCESRARDHTLMACPHFRSGDCWAFARLHGWNQQLKVADTVYAGSAAALDGKDLIPSSPSLEVGYDDEGIQLVYQHKAPPSAASFIQRRGRAGRNPNDSPVIITLLWPHRRDDAFYFYHPEALYDPDFDDAPLNPGNFNVQRTHSLLAFFDLLACLRRQNVDGLADDPLVPDFTAAGHAHFPLVDEVAQDVRDLSTSAKGVRFVVTRRRDKKQVWFSGGHFTDGHVVADSSAPLSVRGWLLLQNDLASHLIRHSWERVRVAFFPYLERYQIVSRAFRQHPSNPFLLPAGGSLPTGFLGTFGHAEWHSTLDRSDRSNWLKSYRWIDWMLQGSEDATTLTVHYPAPAVPNGAPDAAAERTTDVTFGLTELLPGNVSYRLREGGAIHWTPIPAEGESTFLYPEEDVKDEQGNVIARQCVPEFLPPIKEISAQRDSVFGVPRHLADRFPGLQFMQLRRLRVEVFGSPNQQVSTRWCYDPGPRPEAGQARELPPGVTALSGCLPVSRRSSTSASSAIVPYIASIRGLRQRQLARPLNTLFGAIDGYLEEGSAMLGYTRVYYEMQISLRQPGAPEVTLTRSFYPPPSIVPGGGPPKPILAGYSVETQGVCFQVNGELLRKTFAAIQDDEELRLSLRQRLVQYRIASRARELEIYPAALLYLTEVAVEYWRREVVPSCQGEPRLLDLELDRPAIVDYLRDHRNLRPQEVPQHAQRLTPEFFRFLNEELETAFRETPAHADFAESVTLHSLGVLLKILLARLGGVASDEMVVYTDMPVLEQVDRSIQPRILVMDTVEGGSGAVAQAFERLDLTDSEGSLWWMLQRDLGECPIGNAEALVRTVLTRATEAQITATQQQATPQALRDLVGALDLTPLPETVQALGRALFNEIQAGTATINPALLLRELYLLHEQLSTGAPGVLPQIATIRTAVRDHDPIARPHVAHLRAALEADQISGADLDYELAVQLTALFQCTCEDGCPVCLGAGSDVESYHVAPLLNSRRVLRKLRGVLLASMKTGDSLAALAASLIQNEPVRVQADPGGLANRLEVSLGLGVVAQTDETGQVQETVVVPVDEDNARALLIHRDGWTRWGAPEIETPGGSRVRSRAEFIIATWLWEQGIAYEYETPLPYRDPGGGTSYIHPDFFLWEHDLYVEFWGRDDPEYLESRRFKEEVYEKRGIRPVHIEKDEVNGGEFKAKIRARIKGR